MNIVYNSEFYASLDEIVDFIAQDSTKRATKFKDEILSQIDRISFMPFSYPKNRYYNDENIRNLIFKGYKVLFYISISNDEIVVFGIYKSNLPNF